MKQVNLTMLLLAVALCASVQLEAQTQVRRYVMNGKMPKSNADRTTTWADAGKSLWAGINASQAGDEIGSSAGGDYPNRLAEEVSAFANEGNIAGMTLGLVSSTGRSAAKSLPSIYLLPNSRGVVHIKRQSAGKGDGSSWENAYGNLADALLLAAMQRSGMAGVVAASDTIRQIWVAEGTYYPEYKVADDDNNTINTNDRDKSFVLVKGVKVYGGFPDNASSSLHKTVESRFTQTIKSIESLPATVLSGDLDSNDGDCDFTSINRSSNVYHVIVAADIVASDGVVIDGLHIRGGHADYPTPNPVQARYTEVNGKRVYSNRGGGIYNMEADYTMSNLMIDNNYANSGGGGMCSNQSSVVINKLIVRGNMALTGGGGGIAFNSVQNANRAKSVVNNTLLSGNRSVGGGGGIANLYDTLVLNNVTITANIGNYGGGFYTDYTYPDMVIINNTIIQGNKSSYGYMDNTNRNSMIYRNCLIEGYSPSSGDCLDGWLDPEFESMATTFNYDPNTDGNYRLKSVSPAIDRGNSEIYLEARGIAGFLNETDVDGNARGSGRTIDLGAYESRGVVWIQADNRGIVYVKDGGEGNQDGSSWDHAYPNLANPLRLADQQRKGSLSYRVGINDTIRQIWVAKGIYYPMHRVADKDMSGVFSATDCDMAFVLVKGVKLYGGFPENARSDIHTEVDTRFSSNCNSIHCLPETVLSGDLGKNDSQGSKTDNVYHVVIAASIAAHDGVLVDGFHITGGYNSPTSYRMLVNGCTIHRRMGGGVYNDRSTYEMRNVFIDNNSATNSGGGIYNDRSLFRLINSAIRGNSAQRGGGIFNSPYTNPEAELFLANVLISGNSASNSGGIYNANHLMMINSTMVDNNGSSDTGGLYNDIYPSAIINSIIWGNKPTNVEDNGLSMMYRNSLVEGEDLTNLSGADNLNGLRSDSDPKFINAAGASAVPFVGGDYRLGDGSGASDRADSTRYKSTLLINGNIVSSEFAYDLAGNKRVSGNKLDLGAYETKAIVFNVDSVYISTPMAFDTMICQGTQFSLIGSYRNNDIMARPNANMIELNYFWEYTIDTVNSPPNMVLYAPNGLFNSGFLPPIACTFAPIRMADSGYYRLAVENNSGFGQYFRTASRYVRVLVYSHRPTPDIRLFVHPAQGMTINMSAYIDMLNYPIGSTIKWIATAGMPPFVANTETTTGTLDVSAWSAARHTYIYKYELDACGLSLAKAYVQTVARYNRIDSIIICTDVSPVINLSRLFGVEGGGNINGSAWSVGVDPEGVIANNMHLVTSGKHTGAMTFDVQAAMAAITTAAYNHPPINNRTARRFEIKYAAGTITKTVWIIAY